MKNNVNLKYLDNYNISDVEKTIADMFEQYFSSNILTAKSRVMLKVDLSSSCFPDEAKTTHPAVINAVVNVLTKNNIKSVIVDSPYKKYNLANLDEVYFNTGMLEVANLTNCELNHNLKTKEYEIANGFKLKSVKLLEEIDKVDAIINISKLKFDSKLGLQCATSNLLGLVPGELKTTLLNRCEKLIDYHNLLLDIYTVVKDKLVLNVVDGIVSLEEDSTPRLSCLLAVSDNNFSLEAVLNDMFDIDLENTILAQAEERGYISTNKMYKLQGEKPDRFKLPDLELTERNQFSLVNNNKKRKRYIRANQERTVIDDDKCKGCSVCSKICPTGAIMMKYDKNGELYAHIDYEKCIYCHKCYVACPYKIVEVKTPHKYKKLQKEIEKQN